MNKDRPAPASSADADLERRLHRALRDGLGGGQVAVEAVAAGTRERTHQLRARRRTIAVAGAAVLVSAVPIAVSFGSRPDVNRQPDVSAVAGPAPSTPPVASASHPGDGIPAASRTSVPPTQVQRTPTSPSWTAPPGDIGDPKQVAYRIPGAMAFSTSDFSRTMTLLYNGGNYRLLPTMMGQACGSTRSSDRFPVAARNWSWAEEDSDRLDQISVDFVVTGWATGTGPAHWRDLVNDRGTCRFPFSVTERSSQGMPGDDAWVASTLSNGLNNGFAAIRLGDLIVAVQVIDPAGLDAAVTEARRLALTAARNAQKTGLTAIAG